MALIAFVSSNSVASSFARQRETYDANLELKGLGVANIAGAFFQPFTIVGISRRTAVNVDVGAQSPCQYIYRYWWWHWTAVVLAKL